MRSPDVVATGCESVTLLEAQNSAAASWLGSRCLAQLENPRDQICVDSREEDRIIRDLRAAGFEVIKQNL